MASRMRMTPDQLTQALLKSGIHVNTLKSRIRADMTWQQLVRGRYQSILQIGEKDLVELKERLEALLRDVASSDARLNSTASPRN